MPAIGSAKAPGSSLATAAKKAAAGKAAPTKTSSKVLATPKATVANGMIINTTGGEPTVSSRGSLMPQAQPDGSYAPWSSAGTPAVPAWTLESDPLYQSAMASGQAQFNYARNAALAEKQNTETAKAAERRALDTNATEARRRLAGNYAARGMAGGAAGALSQAEALANARQIAAQTDIKDQLTAVNNQYLQNYGAIGSDWTGTLVGQQYKTQATQQAIDAALSRYGNV